jgi:hypothetical protein
MSCHVVSCHVISCHVMSCHFMSCHIMSCHVMSCHVMSCHVMSCHVMSCHVMSCPSCHVMSSLSKTETLARMKSAATQTRMFVPSGALWGADDIKKMADRGTLKVSQMGGHLRAGSSGTFCVTLYGRWSAAHKAFG